MNASNLSLAEQKWHESWMGVGRREEEWAHTKSFSLLFVCVPLVCSVLSLSRWATPARHHRRPHCTTYREGKERDPSVSHLWQRFAGRNAIIIIIADDSPLSHWTTVWCTLLFPHPPFHSIHPKGGGGGGGRYGKVFIFIFSPFS